MKRLLLFVVIAFEATAQLPALERVMLPVVTAEGAPIPGGFGSLWKSSITVVNGNDRSVIIGGYNVLRFGSCSVSLCVQLPTPRSMTFHPEYRPYPSAPNGTARFLTIEEALADRVTVHLRVHDISRQALTWGTTIPVVRDRDFRSDTVTLVAVPTDPRFRWTLRIYDPDALAEARVRVRYYATNPKLLSGSDPILDPMDPQHPVPDVLLHEQTVTLQRFIDDDPSRFGYAAIASTSLPAPVMEAARLRIDVAPLTDGLRLWAMVSVVNNETQHMTVIAP